jgi:hypothetical protein
VSNRGDISLKCENCAAWNGRVVKDEDYRMILCSKCLKIYKDLNQEYLNIVSVDELTSSEH